VKVSLDGNNGIVVSIIYNICQILLGPELGSEWKYFCRT